jgi:iron complex transport system ATP-binding protein
VNQGPEILNAEGLSVMLGRTKVLDGIDLAVRGGEVVVIVGPNGAGKTTFLRAAAGLVPANGRIAVEGTALSRLSPVERARRVAYLPQGHVFHWPLAVEDIVALGRLPRTGGADLSLADAEAVKRAMAETGVTDYAGRPVTTLSGGERARVALARVLATEAPLVLADEPTASLDPRYQLIVLDTLQRHARQGGAVVAVLHDIGLAARRADRIVVLHEGRLVADGPPREVLTRDLLAQTFGVNVQIVTLVDGPVVIPWTVRPERAPAGLDVPKTQPDRNS